jgi:hypothetical protein
LKAERDSEDRELAGREKRGEKGREGGREEERRERRDKGA